jgi:recombinational DNA repair protein (RecF pathway)
LASLCEFQRSLLIEIGLMPQGENCVGCRSAITPDGAEGVYFTSHEGGLLCRDCEASYVEKRPVSAGAIRVLSGGPVDQSSVVSCQSSVVSSESSVLSPEPSVLDSLAGEVFALLNYHISHLMHKEPRLAKFVLAD